MNAIVIGSSGAIGNAIVRHLLKHYREVKTLHCWSRLMPGATELPSDERIVHGYINLAMPESIEQAASTIEPDSLDLVVIATGFLHNPEYRPEKSLKQLTAEQFQHSMQLNALGPALLAQQLLPKMRRRSRSVFAALSARVSSVSDNRLGGWYSYRSSKAALNMLLSCMAIEFRRNFPHLIVAGLHPGTVDSELSKPFQSNLPEQQLFTPDYSASCLLKVIDGLTADDSGKLFAWDGQRIQP